MPRRRNYRCRASDRLRDSIASERANSDSNSLLMQALGQNSIWIVCSAPKSDQHSDNFSWSGTRMHPWPRSAPTECVLRWCTRTMGCSSADTRYLVSRTRARKIEGAGITSKRPRTNDDEEGYRRADMCTRTHTHRQQEEVKRARLRRRCDAACVLFSRSSLTFAQPPNEQNQGQRRGRR
jgi:hypothetical protein